MMKPAIPIQLYIHVYNIVRNPCKSMHILSTFPQNIIVIPIFSCVLFYMYIIYTVVYDPCYYHVFVTESLVTGLKSALNHHILMNGIFVYVLYHLA